jgi:hypothetical protein
MTALTRRKKKLRAVGKLRRELHAAAKRAVASGGFGIRKLSECCFNVMLGKKSVASFQARPTMNLSAVLVVFVERGVDLLVHKRAFALSNTPKISSWLRKIVQSIQARNVECVMSE